LAHLLGRVTFHLAENKRNPERPFAFLATYTHRISGQSRLQHLPLADALKTYAEAKDRPKLNSLLEPVRQAAETSTLVRELLTSRGSVDFLLRQDFHPGITQYEFLPMFNPPRLETFGGRWRLSRRPVLRHFPCLRRVGKQYEEKPRAASGPALLSPSGNNEM
jgi:hypothetical protein